MFRVRKKAQIGRGLGGLMLGFLPRLIPVIKSAFQWVKKIITGKTVKNLTRKTAETVANSVKQAGIKTVQDAVTGENIGESLKKNIGEAGTEILNSTAKNVGQIALKTASNKFEKIAAKKRKKKQKINLYHI